MAVAGRRIVPGLAIALVLGAIVAGLLVVGSPDDARVRRLDQRRVQDLAAITHAVNRYWTREAGLPSSLDQLLESPGTAVEGRDPLTAEPYHYAAVGGKAYELCADFQGESIETGPDGSGRFWSHGPGRRCFRLDAEETRR